MNNLQPDIHDGEIDLLELIKVIWDKKRIIPTYPSSSDNISEKYDLK